MKSIQQYIRSRIEQRKAENNFRSLKTIKGLVDLYSNDYLGFSRSAELEQLIAEELKNTQHFLGSTGSRLLSGNNEYVEALEQYLAQFYQAPAALVFNSGFDANYGLISTLPYRDDTIIYDELVHASIHDGIRNSKAGSVAFKHNDVASLKEKLAATTGLKYVVIETVYSMDGDVAPVKQIAALCKEYEAGLIVDEAHAVGVFGKNGEGIIVCEGLAEQCLARVNTFGKALGAHGAAILGSNDLKEFLVNYCRPFIFSTALPLHSLATIKCAHQYLMKAGTQRERMFGLIKLFKQSIVTRPGFELRSSDGPIQSLVISGNNNVKQAAQKLQQAGFDARPILHPTVPKGEERIRICIHSFNTETEVAELAKVINDL